MKTLTLLPYYFQWHYGYGLLHGIEIIKNFIWFLWHFFSIRELFRTLFLPWQRLHETRQGSAIEDFMSVWIVNSLMIFVGALIRLTVIAFGFVFIIAALVAGSVVLLLWIALPLLIVVFFIMGFGLLFKPI
ncbi:hypothetical protein KW782_04400 [Candidatus Parcubacteria bacterium]|nr:hypothetical protein [Candidatus Parcubacteria bacterium]